MPPAIAPMPAPAAAPTGPPTTVPVTAPVVAPAATPLCAFAAKGNESAAATVRPARILMFMKSSFVNQPEKNVEAGERFPRPKPVPRWNFQQVPTFARYRNQLAGRTPWNQQCAPSGSLTRFWNQQ